ncbi:hypothetical protein FYM84_19890 [Pseudomonas sp. CAH-1]|uniref:DUF5677 domain-containing protein n=1 Tax=Pseudomonas TaxID=286 RepID=UPI0012AD3368|nr:MULTISPECIES: DUF5677 domain-containing protein [Pseudomonas]MRT62864.1 hypothetical protein [Pseudomonas sp. CAH-1]
MIDKSILSESFFGQGFISPDINEAISHITSENKDWFVLLRDINKVLQAAVVAGFKKYQGRTMDLEVLAMFSALRSLSNFQSVFINLERGMIVEARILIRCLFENAFCLGALAESPEKFFPLLHKDNVAAKRGQAKVLRQGNHSLDQDVATAMDEILAGDKGRHLNWQEVAEMSSLGHQYLFYKHLSDDAMHYSASSLKRYIISNEETNSWSGYKFGPGKKAEVALAANLSASAALGILIGFLQATKNSSRDKEANELLDRFGSLSSLSPE